MRGPKPRLYIYGGKSLSAAQWADELGITLHTFRTRVRNPYLSLAEIFCPGSILSKHAVRPLTHDGRTRTMTGWAAELGISLSALSRRLSRGWPPERVFAAGQQPAAAPPGGPRRPRRMVTHAGKTQSLRDWAEELGLTYNVFTSRLARLGAVPAAFAPGKAKFRMLTHDGRTQPLAAWAREAGIPPHRLLQRLARGWPMSRALLPGDHRRNGAGDEQD